MASTDTIAASIRQTLQSLADDETRRKYERLVPGAKVIGVPVPPLRELAARLRKEHPDVGLEAACDLLSQLCVDRYREEMLVGIFLLGRYGKSIARIPWTRIEGWLPALDNWETCDQLAANVAAAVVMADRTLEDGLVALTAADSPWIRRFAAATAADLTHAGRGAIGAAFKVCGQLLQDPDPMVQKSIGWAIREATKADEAAVFAWLCEVRPSMRPRTLKEAAEKITDAHREALGL